MAPISKLATLAVTAAAALLASGILPTCNAGVLDAIGASIGACNTTSGK
jgi:hypothetical protein